MYQTEAKGTIFLLITALIWGSAFVAQSIGMDYIGPFTFSAARDVIAMIVLMLYRPQGLFGDKELSLAMIKRFKKGGNKS